MKFRARKVIRFGPIYVNFTHRMNPFVALLSLIFTGRREQLFSSWGIKVGPYTRNFTRGTSTVNTPGPGSLHWGGGKPARRKRGQS